ncbi:MAG: glycoside hydrolase family 3 C-terminal domain-containing protein [Lachnospiraceae bacterium]|nr:glycoside hydrolase family 3 C-terminal domain-containing protein [Lachnospiraceae bacterium]
MGNLNIEEILNHLSLEEKASLCSGADSWHTEAIERTGLPAVMLSDGPHGLRKQDETTYQIGPDESIKAVCFPTASAMACSFDRELIYKAGAALGEECQSEDINVLLGPGINMKRSPLCGRNFEYYSEDPYLAGELGAAFVNGVQSQGAGTSLKHFAANNQEWRRMSISSEMDERTLREIYLAAFEKVVKKAQPWTIMCSYNRINGTYSCENNWLLNKVLRDEWGFKGLVMTDWGAMNNRIEAIKAGLDLEMPSSHGETDKLLVAAVKDGSLPEEVLDKAVRRVLELADKSVTNKKQTTYNKEEHHRLAKNTAVNSAVLLKNNGILPLSGNEKIAVIGKFADIPRIQGGGSSHINCFKTESALEALGNQYNYTYSQGYNTDKDETDKILLDKAVKNAADADVAVIFAGLPDSFESEGFDRTHLDMPECQNHLIEEIYKVQKNIVVVLHNGSPVLMPWLGKAGAVLEMYLAGQASGAAAADLLFGKANPSGKLAETFPLRLEDNPSYLDFPGSRDKVHYSEGIFIGYRYYDKRNMDVLFPFGHGLSYTTFRYSNISIEKDGVITNGNPLTLNACDTDKIKVYVDITNTGNMAGAEIVQLYVKNFIGLENRPEKELKNFDKVFLEPGETKTVCMELCFRSFAYYNETLKDWFVESGTYGILIGASSRDIRCSSDIKIISSQKLPFHACDTTTCKDIELFADNTSPLDEMLLKSKADEKNNGTDEEIIKQLKTAFEETPVHSILSFSSKALKYEDIQLALKKLNNSISLN